MMEMKATSGFSVRCLAEAAEKDIDGPDQGSWCCEEGPCRNVYLNRLTTGRDQVWMFCAG